MRELDRVKDKIEIRLDPRQVVTLGVATTVFCGMLFGAGYWAGRRQARPQGNEPADLATLDAASRAVRDEGKSSIPSPALGDVEFLFPAVVAAGPGRGPEQAPVRVPALIVQSQGGLDDTPRVAAAEPARIAPPPEAVRQAALPVAAALPPVEPVRAAPRPVVERPIEPARPAPPLVERAPVAAATPKPAVPPPPDELEAAPAAPASLAAAVPAPPDEDDPKKSTLPREGSSTGGQKAQYTLQVKAARDKGEADAVVEKLRKAGFEPSLIVADVPGKGRYYRVRVGRFENVEKAREFQRKLKAQSGLTDAGFVTDL
jgi:DedD protein